MRHGTKYAYVRYRCRCGDCRAANTAEKRKLVERRRAESGWVRRTRTHGLSSTYNAGCRCEPCTRAASDRVTRWRQARRAVAS